MRNITDALDSYLLAKVRVKQWEDEFMLNFYKPLLNMMEMAAMSAARNNPNIDQNKLKANLSPEARQKLRGE